MLRIEAGLCALLCFWLLHASALAQLPLTDNPATALHALFAEDWEYQMEQHPTCAGKYRARQSSRTLSCSCRRRLARRHFHCQYFQTGDQTEVRNDGAIAARGYARTSPADCPCHGASSHSQIPPLRRLHSIIEGWGLYAESLGDEMGLYDDAYSKFGQLMFEIWRASRLVVDTGIHHLAWDRQKAIDFMVENTVKQELELAAEIDRYIVWPGQALAYKIGQLKISELRAKAKQSLGEKFDIRRFHDEVLRDGAMPLNMLESKITSWLARQKQAETAR